MSMNCVRVWSIGENDTIAFRSGDVKLDADEIVDKFRDTKAILTVEGGLETRDFAVFMIPEVQDIPIYQTEGYFVGQVALDGSGVIVHSSLVEESPESYAVGHIAETWQYLQAIEPQIFTEFGLNSLQSFLGRKR